VKYKGATVSEADVTFVPKDGVGDAAYGTTDALGVAKLTTFHDTPEDGAVAGEYLVAVEKSEGGGDMGSGEEEDTPEESEDETSEDAASGYKSLLPEKYADETMSELTATVSESSKDFTFELTD